MLTRLRGRKARRELRARPLVTVIIPTQGRATLSRVLRSIREQADERTAEVIVVEDTHSGPPTNVRQIAEKFGARYFAHDAGHHCWGHCQFNAMFAHARGRYVAFQDDDDVYVPGTFEAIRRASQVCVGAVPMMFQFFAHWGEIIWPEPRVVEARIGGHCIITPNVPERLGRWGCRYEGDFDFIRSTLAHYPPSSVMWVPRVIVVTRPSEAAA